MLRRVWHSSAVVFVLLALLLRRSEAGRAISWWWSAPSDPNDPGVDGLLSFVRENTAIVTTVIARCGVYTCIRDPSTKRPHARCLNNGGIGGKITGNVSAACLRVIPALAELGVRTELWLGEDDSYESAQYLFAHSAETADDLLGLAAQHPGISGFNIDLESGQGNASDISRFSNFLGAVSNTLAAKGLRFSADVGCRAPAFQHGSFTTNCRALAASGVARLMNMGTYNSNSFEEWVYSRLAPALDVDTAHRSVIGMGMGCWKAPALHGEWSTTALSAQQRVCLLMNRSDEFAPELDMFTIRQNQTDPDYGNWPEPFWIKPLKQWMGGGGCTIELPERTICPNATVGDKTTSWLPGGDRPHCCVSYARRGAEDVCNKTCAEAECAADPGMFWLPENYSTHPYTCCKKPS